MTPDEAAQIRAWAGRWRRLEELTEASHEEPTPVEKLRQIALLMAHARGLHAATPTAEEIQHDREPWLRLVAHARRR